MGAKTKIDWCDSTWNPVTGCLHGCEYCYARRIAERFGGGYKPDTEPPDGYIRYTSVRGERRTTGNGSYIKRNDRECAEICLNCTRSECEEGTCERFKRRSV